MMAGWITQEGPQNEIVLSSRVRLARNIVNTPFPSYLSIEDAHKLINQVKEAVDRDGHNHICSITWIVCLPWINKCYWKST